MSDVKLRMEKPLYGGSMLARVPAEAGPESAGKAVFVPGALPGELVEATLAAERRGYATASVNAVLEAAATRTLPACEYYERCGGCHYQHAVYEAQLAMKREVLRETLARARVIGVPELRTLSGHPWSYRNRIRLLVMHAGASTTLGYRERSSHRGIAVTHCPVAAPLLERAIPILAEALGFAAAGGLRFTEAELFCSDDESALQISLACEQGRADAAALPGIGESLAGRLPELAGLQLLSMNPRTRRLHAVRSWGRPALEYRVGGRRYRVSPGAFFQVNRHLLEPLVQEVVRSCAGETAWDLYAGVGLFACALEGFAKVIAVESSPPAAADLEFNLRAAGGRRRAIAADTLRFLTSAGGSPPDCILLDPPRAGLGKEVCRRLGEIGSRQILYVSCDPATLARDLQALQPSGYRLTGMTLVDLFPQTFHMETVATLERP